MQDGTADEPSEHNRNLTREAAERNLSVVKHFIDEQEAEQKLTNNEESATPKYCHPLGLKVHAILFLL